MPVTPRAPRLDPKLPTIFPSRPLPTITQTRSSPWRRRHTLGELPTFSPSSHIHHRQTNMEAEDKSLRPPGRQRRQNSSSPTPSDRSESGSLSFLTSETYQLVKDMDRESSETSEEEVSWQKKFSRDPSTSSRPWLYRRYSHQVQSMEEDDVPMFNTHNLAKSNKRIADWNYDDIQDQVKKYVEDCKHEKVSRGDQFDELLEEDLELPEGTTDDLDQSLSSSTLLGDSGYMTSLNVSQMGDVSMEPLVIEVPHLDLEELPVETVNPADYPELVYERQEIPKCYTSEANITLQCPAAPPTQTRMLIVLSAHQLDHYRHTNNKYTDF